MIGSASASLSVGQATRTMSQPAAVSSAMRSFARTLPERYSSAGCQTGCSPVAVGTRNMAPFSASASSFSPIPVNLAM